MSRKHPGFFFWFEVRIGVSVSIICVGNEWQLDDGFGPAVARRLLEGWNWPEDVVVLDRGVMGYDIVPDLANCDFALVVDALDGTGYAPGTVLQFAPEDMAVSEEIMSLHDVRFADVLATAQLMGTRCAGGWCFGVQVERLGRGSLERGLSAPVAAAVDPCARAVVAYAREQLGLQVTPR